MGGDSSGLCDAQRTVGTVPLESLVSDDLDTRKDGGVVSGMQSVHGVSDAEIQYHHPPAHGVGWRHPETSHRAFRHADGHSISGDENDRCESARGMAAGVHRYMPDSGNGHSTPG